MQHAGSAKPTFRTPAPIWGLAGLFEFLLLGTAFNITDEVAHKFYPVGFVRGFGIYAKSFFENGQKCSNLKKIEPEILGQVRVRVDRGHIDFKVLRDESVDFA